MALGVWLGVKVSVAGKVRSGVGTITRAVGGRGVASGLSCPGGRRTTPGASVRVRKLRSTPSVGTAVVGSASVQTSVGVRVAVGVGVVVVVWVAVPPVAVAVGVAVPGSRSMART